LVAAVIAAYGLDNSASDWLYMLGGVFECLGVAFVAAPELFPRLEAVANRLAEATRVSFSKLRHLLSSSRRDVASIDATGTGSMTAHAAATVGTEPSRSAPLDVQVEFLRNRVEQHETRLGNIEGEARRIEASLSFEVRETGDKLQQFAKDLQRQSETRHLKWRYAGLGLLFIGLALATAGNLV
jgi:hypothetical protein